ncbi:MAG: hypothetical protein ISR52_10230 [Rhodospirillales bacterium]|nr:hypothetical protein [Rhodospirillales bacterium]
MATIKSSSTIYRVANLLVTEYGEMASIGAIIKADALRDEGNSEGSRLWLKIARVAEELLSDTVPDSAQIH